MAKAPSRYWVIRHPASGGPKKTIAQFNTAGETLIPDRIVNYDAFQIQEINGKSALVDSVDQSDLSSAEKQLLEGVYPVQ